MSYHPMSSNAPQTMSQLTLAQRFLLARVAQSGSLCRRDLTAEEIRHAERLVERGVLREVTIVGIASHDPVRLSQQLTYVCTPLGVAVAKLLE